ncbi:MAG: hypothetical protein DRP11_02675 [Candidatus Aenigmatarchaeota archaeon]|nr:MAG: hypothetical protein DRP11_02675 [Candidatus Aenigmarchaeota archaeon]
MRALLEAFVEGGEEEGINMNLKELKTEIKKWLDYHKHLLENENLSSEERITHLGNVNAYDDCLFWVERFEAGLRKQLKKCEIGQKSPSSCYILEEECPFMDDPWCCTIPVFIRKLLGDEEVSG